MVSLFDSLYHCAIKIEVKDQVQSLMADSFIGIINKPVQQQKNRSDCGIFAIGFVTCLVYDIQKMHFYLSA